jgi:hypothetical protein
MEVDRITPHDARVIQPLQDHEGGTHVNFEPTAIESEQSERTRRLTLAGDGSYGINPSKFGGTGPPFDCTMSVQACSLLPSHFGPRPCRVRSFTVRPVSASEELCALALIEEEPLFFKTRMHSHWYPRSSRPQWFVD